MVNSIDSNRKPMNNMSVREPVRVLHLIDSLSPGGAERMLVELVNNIEREVATTSVCVTRTNLHLKANLDKNIPVYCLGRKHTFDIKALKEFGQIVNKEKIQIIHAHGYSSFRFAYATRMVLNLPVLILVHAHSSKKPERLTGLIGKTGIDYFVGVSKAPVKWAGELIHLPENKIGLIPNSINPTPFQCAKSIDVASFFQQRPIWIGITVANVHPVKDFENLFQSLSLSKHKDEIGLLIAGSTVEEDYVRRCKKLLDVLDMDDRVIFLGSRQDIPQLLASVEFGLLSSERETGPLALLEYMAAGVPFIVTQVGQITEEVKKAGIPACVPIKNPVSFACELDKLLDLSPDERQIRINNAYYLLSQKFDIRTQSAVWNDIYKGMILNSR